MRRFPAVIPSAIAAVLLLVATAQIGEYGYYVFLRWAVCAAAAWLCISALGAERRWLLLVGIPIAILFNPLVPIYLHKQTWVPIDAITAAVLFGFSWAAVARKPKDSYGSNGQKRREPDQAENRP